MYDLQKHAIPTGVPNVSIVLDTDIKILKQLPEIPQNRVVEPRVDRMNKHFVKDVKSIHYFTVFHVAQDLLVIINGEEILVKEGVKCYLRLINILLRHLYQLSSYVCLQYVAFI